jgi:hypothetical protein
MFETLEKRVLFSNGAVTVTSDGNGNFVETPADSKWSLVHNADGTMLLTNTDTNEHVALPTIKSDGSVSLEGTPNADQISVERVAGLPQPADADDLFHILSLTGDPSTGGGKYFTGLIDTNQLNQSVDHERPLLVERQAKLAADQNDPTVTPEQLQDDQQAVDISNGVITTDTKLIDAATNGVFIRYSLAGFYDVYQQITDQTSTQAVLRVSGGDGPDTISIAPNVPMKTSIDGGAGADKIISGARHTVLYGGGGNDRLVSRSKHGGTLDGGKGADRYYDRFGDGQWIFGRIVPSGRRFLFQRQRCLARARQRLQRALRLGHERGWDEQGGFAIGVDLAIENRGWTMEDRQFWIAFEPPSSILDSQASGFPLIWPRFAIRPSSI